jgi:hypothetical protein
LISFPFAGGNAEVRNRRTGRINRTRRESEGQEERETRKRCGYGSTTSRLEEKIREEKEKRSNKKERNI